MANNNITFELWSIDPLELLTNNLTLDELIEAFPVYAHTFGEAVTVAYMVYNNKRIKLDECDMQYLKIYKEFGELYITLQRQYRVYVKQGNLAEMKRLSKGLNHINDHIVEMWSKFITREWR